MMSVGRIGKSELGTPVAMDFQARIESEVSGATGGLAGMELRHGAPTLCDHQHFAHQHQWPIPTLSRIRPEAMRRIDRRPSPRKLSSPPSSRAANGVARGWEMP